jgi:RNA ligase
MNYDFPQIRHIDDVLPYIKDAPEFIVAEKDGYKVINYVVAGHDTFPSMIEDDSDAWESIGWFNLGYAIRRECRGLIFDMEGNLVRRAFHKFFNVNERDETQLERIDWSSHHVILEKLDGSMVTPFYVDGHLRWGTKMGITDTSMEAEAFVASRPDYTELAAHYLQSGFTPVFEWCSNKNRIVLDYPEDRLVLTAMRDTVSGVYMLQDALERIGERYGIPVVKTWSHEQIQKMGTLIDIIRASEGIEGVVVRFDDGHMVKIKADWYVRIHKVKSLLGQERDVVSLILNNELDDMLPLLPQEDRLRVSEFDERLYDAIKSAARSIKILVESNRMEMDRKTFALEHASKFDSLWRGLIFQFWDKEVNEHLTYEAIVAMITKHCGSNASYAKIKEAFLKEVDYV